VRSLNPCLGLCHYASWLRFIGTFSSTQAFLLSSSMHWISASSFFEDCPWLKVPPERRAEMVVLPQRFKGGLCGGSSSTGGKGKMSKLQALAAARQKRAGDEQGNQAKQTPGPADGERHKPTQLPEVASRPIGRRPAASTSASPLAGKDGSRSGQTLRRKSAEAADMPQDALGTQHMGINGPNIKASPSAFAATILGPLTDNCTPHTESITEKKFRFPLCIQFNPTETSAFLGPSPDDTVAAAQSSRGQYTRLTTR
jgi:elongation factor 1 alpha-like protein